MHIVLIDYFFHKTVRFETEMSRTNVHLSSYFTIKNILFRLFLIHFLLKILFFYWNILLFK